MGQRKTCDKVVCRFTWPGVTKDVNLYCKTCDMCQRINKTDVRTKAEMVASPIITTLFQRISCDIVGALPISQEIGNKFIFTIMEHACHFPCTVALTNHKAATLVKELVKYFSLFGLQSQVLHDLGRDFTSKLFSVFLNSFGVKQLKSTVCHPQTNYVERLHRVLKKMLKAYVDRNGTSWDQGLELVLFAYREAPIADYGFSPFELLFGRRVHDPLSIVFDSWWSQPKAEVSKHVVGHLLDIHERLKIAADVVHARQEEQQKKNKDKYDQNAKPLKLKPNDLVPSLQTLPGDP